MAPRSTIHPTISSNALSSSMRMVSLREGCDHFRRTYFVNTNEWLTRPLFSTPTARDRVGEQAHDLEHQGGADECRVSTGIEGRRHLHHVAADQIEPLQAA